MISTISLTSVNSFKQPTELKCDKEVVLVYGLNGSGKTTTSSYLYDLSDPAFSACRIETTQDIEILTYNQKFVEDSFYENGSLRGVFTLSKENKVVKAQVSQIEGEIENLLRDCVKAREEQEKSISNLTLAENQARESVWEVKTKYAGGDRVLEFCLTGLQRKEKLFDYLNALQIDGEPNPPDILQLKERASALMSEDAEAVVEFVELESFDLPHEQIEVFGRAVSGGSDGPVATVIEGLGNSDWVSRGLKFLDEEKGYPLQCPFCQVSSLNESLLASIKAVFDESYDRDKGTVNQIVSEYKSLIEILNPLQDFDKRFWTDADRDLYLSRYKELTAGLQGNLAKAIRKQSAMATVISVEALSDVVDRINDVIRAVNKRVNAHNFDILNKARVKSEIKKQFWLFMRQKYSGVIDSFRKRMAQGQKNVDDRREVVKQHDLQLDELNSKLLTLRSQTVNIDSAIDSINSRLSDLGISGFTIQKYNDDMYRLARVGMDASVFKTLSEGEKTIISFLYFIERCHGVIDPAQAMKPKVVVIDDPISSLSQQYVFNIGQYIKREFVNNTSYAQVIVLTHSLYFFYELTFTKKVDRDARQSLYRIRKDAIGSTFCRMRYEEIQNDYQTYWSVVKNPNENSALIANCMRNIIEHFFAFVRKYDYNNVFQLPALAEDKFQSFNRYMNRESHSLGQNIFDIKEFDYGVFIDGLRAVFEETGYPDHYKAMMK